MFPDGSGSELLSSFRGKIVYGFIVSVLTFVLYRNPQEEYTGEGDHRMYIVGDTDQAITNIGVVQ